MEYDHFYIEDPATELQQQLVENINLKQELQELSQENTKLKEKLLQLDNCNYKLSQNLEYESIQVSNLRAINNRLTIALRGLASNKYYIQNLLSKKNRTKIKINKLVATVKNLQQLLKHKNATIHRISYQNNNLLEKATRIIKESYSI